MKNSVFTNPQFRLIALFLLITLNASAQKPVIWIGGTPGMKNEWNCPQNWSTSSVPDEFSDVIIPDVSTSSFSLPIIKSGKIEVNSIFIQSNGSMTIEKDVVLVVLGDAEGVLFKTIHGEGELVMPDVTSTIVVKMIASRTE